MWSVSLVFDIAPSEFLAAITNGRTPGSALDIGMGLGRNAVWLAGQGWSVTGIDQSERSVVAALQNARRLGVHVTGVVAEDQYFSIGSEQWDLILYSYITPRFPERITGALRPGGILVVEAGATWFTKENDLARQFPDLKVLYYDELYGLLTRFCGEKRLYRVPTNNLTI